MTHGVFRLVRHSLYLGEMISGFGILLPALAPFAVIIFLYWIGVQLWRTVNEERALATAFPKFATYRARTRRIIPFLW